MPKFEIRDLRIGRSSESDRDQIAGAIVWDGEQGQAEISFFIEVDSRRDHMGDRIDIRSESANAIVSRVTGIVSKLLDPRNVPDIGPLTPPRPPKQDEARPAD